MLFEGFDFCIHVDNVADVLVRAGSNQLVSPTVGEDHVLFVVHVGSCTVRTCTTCTGHFNTLKNSRLASQIINTWDIRYNRLLCSFKINVQT